MKRHAVTCALSALAVSALALTPKIAHAQVTGPDYEVGPYYLYHLDRSWDGVGAESGPISRARVVTRDMHATPDFVVEGSPFTRTPGDVPVGVETPNRFGVPGDVLIRVPVRIAGTWIDFDPFATLDDRAPERVKRAQRRWLSEYGYVDHARIVRKVDRRHSHVQDAEGLQSSRPQPRAIIRMPEKPSNEPNSVELQVRRDGGDRIIITDGDWVHRDTKLAASK